MGFRRLLLILCSAGLHTLAFPPWNIAVAAAVALVPLLCALRDLRPGAGFLGGVLWGTAAAWGFGYWVPVALAYYWEQPVWFSTLFSLGAAIVFAGSYYGGFAACACWISARWSGVGRVVLLAALWVSWELARARLLTGDPWLLLGYALVPHAPLIQVADLGGVYLLSFVVVLANAALAEALLHGRRRARAAIRSPALAVAVLVVVYGYGVYRLGAPLPSSPVLRLAVVQGNNDPGTQWHQQFYGQGLEQYLQLSRRAADETRPELIIWPESAITFFLAHEPRYLALIRRMSETTGADLILGGPHYEDPDPARPEFFNSAFYVTSDGRLAGRYDKSHLLPFAEYFPLKTIELLRRRFERVRSFTPGDGITLLDTRFGRVATVICFEGIFPELVRGQMARGARFLINLSNDSWLGTGGGPEQHMAMVVLRAVENRTWVVRATTTGISAIIDPVGRVHGRTATFTPAILHGHIVPLQATTVYQRWGDVFAYGCVVLCAIALVPLSRASK